MDKRVFDYLGDRVFYDVPRNRAPQSPYRLPSGPDWSRWQRHRSPAWDALHIGPPLPAQGWKIHVAATLANAQRLLDAVAVYAGDRELCFKFVPDPAALLTRNGKQTHRGMSGKFITLYPRDERELERTVRELDARIGGEDGPYILSDLRWRRGPVHVRYGGFLPMTTLQDDEDVPAIVDGAGALVPDTRSAEFVVPPWVDLPAFLADDATRLADTAPPDDFPYRVTEVVHYSNGGGVYRAEGADGERVILKEGRPFAGLSQDGRDAVERLAHEAANLRLLEDDSAIVSLRAELQTGDHRFLALEEVEGMTLNKAVTQRCPMVRADADVVDYLDYRDWALRIVAQLDAVVARMHARALVHGDLHPSNVMVRPDDRIVLIDLEMAHASEDAGVAQAGAPGFTPPPEVTGPAADRWSAAAVALSLFVPLTPLLALDPGKAETLIDLAVGTYLLPAAFADRLRRDLGARVDGAPRSLLARNADAVVREWPIGSEDGLFALQVLVGRSIEASADFSRADRCYPGDPQQFRENGWGLAHGVAGVLHAELASSLDLDPLAIEWMLDAIATDPAPRLGFHDGLAGAEWVLRRAGEGAAADRLRVRLLDELAARGTAAQAADLSGGLAGIGIALLTGSDAVDLELPVRFAVELADRLQAGTAFPAGRWRSRRGLMSGPTGIALFALRLYERTREPGHLRLAQHALDLDMAHLVHADDGSLQLDEGWRLMPYLAAGSAGVAVVAAQLAPHVADDAAYLEAIAGIRLALQAPFTIESTLATGRAGFIHALVALERLGFGTPEAAAALDRHVDALRLHAIPHAAGIAFAGSGLLRASSDLATGSAGALTALQAYGSLRFDSDHDGWRHVLPLVLPPAGTAQGREVNHDDGIPPQPAAP